MKTLLIDDLRNIEADRIARTFDDGINALKNEGPWDLLYLDHDLGEIEARGGFDPRTTQYGLSLPKNGYGIMQFLEVNPGLKPGEIILVTSNPVGRRNMQVVIDKLYGRET